MGGLIWDGVGLNGGKERGGGKFGGGIWRFATNGSVWIQNGDGVVGEGAGSNI